MGMKMNMFQQIAPPDTLEQAGLKELPVKALEHSPENFYRMEGIETLAANIQAVGLQQPLVVFPAGGGKWYVETGNRRLDALRMLGWETVLCKVVRDPREVEEGSAGHAQHILSMISTNQYRELTDAEQAEGIRRAEQAVRELRDAGYTEYGGVALEGTKTRTIISRLTGISETKIAQLSAISNRLNNDLKGLYKDGGISTAMAYALSQRPPEEQTATAQRLAQGESITAQAVREMAGKPSKKPPKKPSAKSAERDTNTMPLREMTLGECIKHCQKQNYQCGLCRLRRFCAASPIKKWNWTGVERW